MDQVSDEVLLKLATANLLSKGLLSQLIATRLPEIGGSLPLYGDAKAFFQPLVEQVDRCTPPHHRPGAGSSRTVAARAGRFHRRDGELLKLGFELAQSSVAKYMVKRREPPNQGWRTFLRYTQLGRGHVLPFRRTNPLLIMTQLVWRATGRCAATAHHRP